MRTTTMLLLAPAILVCAGLSAEDTPTVQQMQGLAGTITSYAADVENTVSLDDGTSMSFGGSVRRKGSMIESIVNVKTFLKEMTGHSVVDPDGTLWMEIDDDGEKKVHKFPAGPTRDEAASDFAASLDELSGSFPWDLCQTIEKYGHRYDLKFIRTEIMDGAGVYMFAGDLIDKTTADVAYNVAIYAGTMDGFPRKVVLSDEKGKSWFTTTYKNVLLNAPLHDAVFAYSPPEGVPVEEHEEPEAPLKLNLDSKDFEGLNKALDDDTYEKKAEEILKDENP